MFTSPSCNCCDCEVLTILSPVLASQGSWTFDGSGYVSTEDDAWLIFRPRIGNGSTPWYAQVTIDITHPAGATPNVYFFGGADTTPGSVPKAAVDHDGYDWSGPFYGAQPLAKFRHSLGGYKSPRGTGSCPLPTPDPLEAGVSSVTMLLVYDGASLTLFPTSAHKISHSGVGIAGGRVGFGITEASGSSVRFHSLSAGWAYSEGHSACGLYSPNPCYGPVPETVTVEIPPPHQFAGTYICRNCSPTLAVWDGGGSIGPTHFQIRAAIKDWWVIGYPFPGYTHVGVEFGNSGLFLTDYWLGYRGILRCEEWTNWIDLAGNGIFAGTTARIRL